MATEVMILQSQAMANPLLGTCSNVVPKRGSSGRRRFGGGVAARSVTVMTAGLPCASTKLLRKSCYNAVKKPGSRSPVHRMNSVTRPRVVADSTREFTATATVGGIAEEHSVIINPAEALLEKFAHMPPSNTGETTAADRLFLWEDVPKLAKTQTFSVFELNEFDRDSPAVLEFSRHTVNKLDPETGDHISALGDQVPFTNKLYDCSLRTRLGITAGICLLMKNYPGKGTPEMHQLPFFVPNYYETIMSWYFGDMGHICAQGPFINFQDTLMAITGGTGFFREARGVVRLHNLTPFKFYYTFTLTGIPELPKQLTGELVAPTIHATSHPDAFACNVGHALPNYTD